METSAVPNVGKIDRDPSASVAAQSYPPIAEAEARVKVSHDVSSDLPITKVEHPKESKVVPSSQKNVQLRFQVDSESQELTILVLDRNSQKVIRTIPSSELYKMNEGDLISLFA